MANQPASAGSACAAAAAVPASGTASGSARAAAAAVPAAGPASGPAFAAGAAVPAPGRASAGCAFAAGAAVCNPVRVGTDCSGIGMALFALRALGVSFHHVFASDVDPNARAFLQEHHPADIMYHDLRNRHLDDMPSVDLYIAGFPCQPFSSSGFLQCFGAFGGKGLLFFQILEYIKVKQPRAFLLENVAGLLTVNQGTCFSLSALVGYQSQWRLMNTQDHGVPQNRPQVFIVGMLQRMCFTPFRFPDPLSPTPFELFLDLRVMPAMILSMSPGSLIATVRLHGVARFGECHPASPGLEAAAVVIGSPTGVGE